MPADLQSADTVDERLGDSCRFEDAVRRSSLSSTSSRSNRSSRSSQHTISLLGLEHPRSSPTCSHGAGRTVPESESPLSNQTSSGIGASSGSILIRGSGGPRPRRLVASAELDPCPFEADHPDLRWAWGQPSAVPLSQQQPAAHLSLPQQLLESDSFVNIKKDGPDLDAEAEEAEVAEMRSLSGSAARELKKIRPGNRDSKTEVLTVEDLTEDSPQWVQPSALPHKEAAGAAGDAFLAHGTLADKLGDLSPQDMGTAPRVAVAAPGITIVGTLDVEVDEWIRYVESLHLVRVPEQAVCLPLLGEALAGVPVPAPWLLCRGPGHEIFFANETTCASSFLHPFDESLQQLARLCPVLLALPVRTRQVLLRALRQACQDDVTRELGSWCAVASDSGQDYFFHSETRAVMWEQPSDIVWPAHCMKLATLDQLNDDSYMDAILRGAGSTRQDVLASARQAVELGESLSDVEIIGCLANDQSEWIRIAIEDALCQLTEGEPPTPVPLPSTSTSWFSAVSRITVQSVQ